MDEIVGTTGLSVTAKVKVMSEPMYSVRHMVKEMVMDELDDVRILEVCHVRRMMLVIPFSLRGTNLSIRSIRLWIRHILKHSPR